jgi:hypothetical protein
VRRASSICRRIASSPNPNPAELKRLFPAAAAFAPRGELLHFKAYGADPKTNLSTPTIGIAF